jgi:Niemann-Pick C1 protein
VISCRSSYGSELETTSFWSSVQLTFFAGIMTLDKRRQDSRRLDVFCCIKSSAPVDQGWCCGVFGAGRPRERISTKVMRGVAHLLARKWCRIVVVLCWLGAVGAGIYGTSQMKVDADINDFIPKGSYLRDTIKITEDYFDNTGDEVQLYWVNSPEVSFDGPR